MQFSNNFYKYVHNKILTTKRISALSASLSVGLFDFISAWLPFGNSWLHEEWHRSVLSQFDIKSQNDIYDFNFFSASIAVSHLKDEDLVRLKSTSPIDMIRLHSAGLESQYEQNLNLEKEWFFNATSGSHIVLWLNYVNSSYYLYTCASTQADSFTISANTDDGEDIKKRDFTGLDCSAWVYDLFRPYEPYESRGTHPSGKGIDRYISYSDLTRNEKKYLLKQRNLSLINLLDPFLAGKSRYTWNDVGTFYWNLSFRHHLTSFGYSLDSNLFINYKHLNLMLILHRFVNSRRGFAGVDIELYRKSLQISNKQVFLNTRIAVWQQPKKQLFQTSIAESGGLINTKLSVPITRRIESYIELEAKSAGWVAGNVYLKSNISVRTGFIGHIF